MMVCRYFSLRLVLNLTPVSRLMVEMLLSQPILAGAS